MILHLLSKAGDEMALENIRAMGPATVVLLAGGSAELPGCTVVSVAEITAAGAITWPDLAQKLFEAEKIYGW